MNAWASNRINETMASEFRSCAKSACAPCGFSATIRANWLPSKVMAYQSTEWLPLEIPASPLNLRYLTAKRNKLGHVLHGL